jgi:hypothetical protein
MEPPGAIIGFRIQFEHGRENERKSMLRRAGGESFLKMPVLIGLWPISSGSGTCRESLAYQAKRKSVAWSRYSTAVGGLRDLGYVQEESDALSTLGRPVGIPIPQPAERGLPEE